MPPENIQDNNNKNISILIFVAVALVIVAYLIMKIPSSEKTPGPEVSWADASSENQMERLPKGFPTNIPVEIDELEESYSVDYPEGVRQSVVSFYTQTSAEDAYFLYEYFMDQDGYDFGPYGKSPTNKTLIGSKNGSELNIIIGVRNGRVFVQAIYLDRSELMNKQQNERR